MVAVLMLSENPADWLVPDPAKIELKEAVQETVATLFGAAYVAPMTSKQIEAESRKIGLGMRWSQSRSGRWEAAKYLLRRALRTGKLHLWIRDNPTPIDQEFWRQRHRGAREMDFQIFDYNSKGKPGGTTYCLDRAELQRWAADVVGKQANPPARKARKGKTPPWIADLDALLNQLAKAPKSLRELNAYTQAEQLDYLTKEWPKRAFQSQLPKLSGYSRGVVSAKISDAVKALSKAGK